MLTKTINKNTVEITCLTCDGAGTLPDKGAVYGIALCHGCNGHGVVVYEKKKHVHAKYEALPVVKESRLMQ